MRQQHANNRALQPFHDRHGSRAGQDPRRAVGATRAPANAPAASRRATRSALRALVESVGW